jgi:signal transduction histidine kinase
MLNLTRMPLTLRMVVPVIGVSAVLLGVGLVTAWYVQRLQGAAAKVLAQNVESIRAAQELEIGLRKVRSRINTFRLTGDQSSLAEIPPLRAACEESLHAAVGRASTEREQALMQRVQRGHERFFEECDRLIEMAKEPGRHEAQWNRINDILTQEIVLPAHEYTEINAALMTQSSAQGEVVAKRMVVALLVLGITGPVAGLLAGFGIARGVSRSIVQLSVPIRDTAGKLTEVVGPITASGGAGFEFLESQLRKLADHVATVVERLQQSQREVMRSEQLAAVGQLAAGIAHELRNPLMSIKLLGQAASKQGDGACLRGKDIEVLNVAATRLEKSLQGLLDFARPSKPEKQSFEMQRLVDETIALVAGRASRQSVQIEVDAPEEPVTLLADRGQIHQVLLNLFLNALDAMPSGGKVIVQLRCHESAASIASLGWAPEQNGCVHISVADTGCGLDPDSCDRIFEPFVSSKDTGTGLGLTISRRIIEEHGGQIEGANRPEGGAAFTIRLPTAATFPQVSTKSGHHAEIADRR